MLLSRYGFYQPGFGHTGGGGGLLLAPELFPPGSGTGRGFGTGAGFWVEVILSSLIRSP
jgi:hypothetical protein